MVELVCLGCGRTNPSDARFCSHCGAALLRKFCDRCRAVNDAEALFCQSCGAPLPEQRVPATSMQAGDQAAADTFARGAAPTHIPTLDQVIAPDEAGESPAAEPASPRPGPSRTLPPEAPALPHFSAAETTHRPALLALAGVLVLLLVAALWWRAPRTDVRSREADTAATRAAAPANVPAAPPVPAAATESPAATTATGGSETGEGSAPTTREAAKAGEADTEAQPAPLSPPPPAAPSRRIRTEPRGFATGPPTSATTPAAPSPSPPAVQCTPQADALGLCAPGATVTGR